MRQPVDWNIIFCLSQLLDFHSFYLLCRCRPWSVWFNSSILVNIIAVQLTRWKRLSIEIVHSSSFEDAWPCQGCVRRNNQGNRRLLIKVNHLLPEQRKLHLVQQLGVFEHVVVLVVDNLLKLPDFAIRRLDVSLDELNHHLFYFRPFEVVVLQPLFRVVHRRFIIQVDRNIDVTLLSAFGFRPNHMLHFLVFRVWSWIDSIGSLLNVFSFTFYR